MIRDYTIERPGALLRASDGGDGDSVVMLHAGVADRRMWRETMPALSARYGVIAYDRRGFGETQASDEAFSQVDDLRAVLIHAGAERAVLIGCSQGGRIAIDYALAHPESVVALVLIATAVTGAPPSEPYAPMADVMAALEEAEERNDLDRVNALEARLWLDGPLGAEGRVTGEVLDLFLDMNGIALRHAPLTREQASASAMERLHTIAAPTLIVCGDLDFPHIQARSEQIAALMPNAQSMVMPGCAHLPSLEQAERLNSAIAAFLKTL